MRVRAIVLFASLALYVSPALAQEEEDIEIIDTEPEFSSGPPAGQPASANPEADTAQAAQQERMIRYIMGKVSEECQGVLMNALQTPQEQQGADILGACAGPVNEAAQEFQATAAGKPKAKERKSAGSAPKEPKPAKAKAGGPLIAPDSNLPTIVTVLAFTLLPLVACVGFAYVKAASDEARMRKLRAENPEAFAKEQEEERRKQRKEEKRAEMQLKNRKGK